MKCMSYSYYDTGLKIKYSVRLSVDSDEVYVFGGMENEITMYNSLWLHVTKTNDKPKKWKLQNFWQQSFITITLLLLLLISLS